jgi:uncharacterized protein (DUF934 family)
MTLANFYPQVLPTKTRNQFSLSKLLDADKPSTKLTEKGKTFDIVSLSFCVFMNGIETKQQ